MLQSIITGSVVQITLKAISQYRWYRLTHGKHIYTPLDIYKEKSYNLYFRALLSMVSCKEKSFRKTKHYYDYYFHCRNAKSRDPLIESIQIAFH